MPSIVKLTLESNQYERGIKNAQKSLNDFTRAVGINVKALSGVAVAAGAVTTALKVANDAFKSSRDLVDEWGRTLQSAQSIYDGFINALNTGDFSNFINNMSNIAKAAREAYDAVSDLELLNAYNAGSLQRAKTGFTGSVADFRAGEGTAQGVKDAAEVLKNQLRERKTAELNALVKAVEEEAKIFGMDAKSLSNALKENFTDFTNRMHSNKPESYTGTSVVPMWGSGTVAGAMSGTFSPVRVKQVPGTDEERLSDFARRATPELIQKLRKYEVMSEATEEEIRQIDKQVTRMLGKAGKAGKGGSGGGGKSGNNPKQELTELQQNQKIINALTQQYVDILGSASKAGVPLTDEEKKQTEEIQNQIKELEKRNGLLGLYAAQAKGLMTVLPEDIQTNRQFLVNGTGSGLTSNPFASDTNAMETGGLKLTLDDKTMKTVMDQISKTLPTKKEVSVTQEMGKIAGGISSIVGGIESLGVEIPEGLKGVLNGMQSMISILSGISTVVLAIEAIAGADALIPFARGGVVHAASGWSGMVPGNMFSGDQVPAMLDSGELVLNKFQQEALAANLNGGGQTTHLTVTLSGEDLLVAVNRVGKRKGYGEVCFFKE